MIQNDSYFKLFANCIPVRGSTRSVIYDLQKMRYRFIPNLLYDIITFQQNKTVGETKEVYHHQYDEGINAFFTLLLNEEWGFFTREPECFPDLDLKWDSPYKITNAIIDIGEQSNHDFQLIVDQLNSLGCAALQIRAYCVVSEDVLAALLHPTLTSRLKHVDLIIKYSEQLTKDYLFQLVSKNRRINHIVIHSSPFNEVYEIEDALVRINYSQEEITSCSSCGQISASTFAINIPLFTESQKYNSCLNRKIAIDIYGNIKNCPSMTESFGNIEDMSLQAALVKKDFQSLWKINKDQIEVCKDCEFRYICTDCRAYISDSTNIYSKPSKCTYNPYEGKWYD